MACGRGSGAFEVAIYGKNLNPSRFYFAVVSVCNIFHASGVHFSSILSEAGRVLFIVQKESYDIWQRLGIMTGCVLLIMWSAMFKKESKRAKGIIKLRNFSGLMKCWETYSGNFYSPVFIVAFGGLTLQVVCHRRAIACLDEKWPSAQKRKRWN
ncbi:unnamed protein product, partial [Mesorhabditis belari]|uniref:Uncharacterized protein n=1 Tax=Mesorhabditis belari TaxID=2138241 RepID=A0AAF3F835_9BILA